LSKFFLYKTHIKYTSKLNSYKNFKVLQYSPSYMATPTKGQPSYMATPTKGQPSYLATPTKGQPSYLARFQMHKDSKIILVN
jgi:hypothetical protein